LVLPYAKLKGLGSSLSSLAGMLGAGDVYPERLTGLAGVKMGLAIGDQGTVYAVLFLLPAVVALLMVLAVFFGKKKGSYITAIIVSILMLIPYGFITLILQDFDQMGYNRGIAVPLMMVLLAVQFIVAIISCVKDKGGVPAKEKGGVPAKEKGHVLIGLRGSYEGASIPMRAGEPVTIGRDPSTCSLVLKDERVSRKHCTLVYDKARGGFVMEDFSTNGVLTQSGSRYPRNTVLNPGDVILIGEDSFEVR